RGAGEGAIVVHDVPLIAENDLASAYDLVVVVDAPDHTRLERLTRHRAMTEEQARARMAAQAGPGGRPGDAGPWGGNPPSRGALGRQVGDLWTELRRRARLRASH